MLHLRTWTATCVALALCLGTAAVLYAQPATPGDDGPAPVVPRGAESEADTAGDGSDAEAGDGSSDATTDSESARSETPPGTRIDDPFEPPAYDPDDTGSGSEEQVTTDRVYVKDGSVIDGTITGYRDGHFTISSASLGEVRVHPDTVRRFSLTRERLFYVQELSGTESTAVLVSVGAQGELSVREANSDQARGFDPDAVFRMSSVPIPTSEWLASVTALLAADFGNVRDLTFGIAGKVVRESRHEYLGLSLEFAFSQTGNSVSRRLLSGEVLYRIFLFDAFGLFGRERARDDQMSGIRFGNSLVAGASWRPLLLPSISLILDAGIGYTFQSRVGEEREYFTGMTGMTLSWHPSTTWRDTAVVLFSWDFGDVKEFTLTVENEWLLVVDQSWAMGIRLENIWRGDPADGFKRNDLRILATVRLEIR